MQPYEGYDDYLAPPLGAEIVTAPPPPTILGSIQGVLALQLASNLLSASGNGTEIHAQELLERYIPGFGTVHSLLLQQLGLDVTLAVSCIALGLAFLAAAQWLWKQTRPLILDFCTSMVCIPSNDRLNKEVLAWMSSQVVAKHGTRALAAVSTGFPGANGTLSHVRLARPNQPTSSDLISDFEDRTPTVTFFPALGVQWFWFDRRLFMFERQAAGRYGSFVQVPTGNEPLILRCIGRNPQPLKDFLRHCKEVTKQSEESKTVIFSRGDDRYNVQGMMWSGPQLVLNRPLDTVELDDHVKTSLVQDVEDYLKHETREYYAINGIPYRRGYLFHGPPGTGKSSFCRALAGHFRLELYMLSLASSTIDEATLIRMFEALPTKCLVLLEDIDSAGIAREEAKGSVNATELLQADRVSVGPPPPPPPPGMSWPRPTRPGTFRGPGSFEHLSYGEAKSVITLSTLLNVIDGTTAKEGRILVMTTNSPESLDKALIRPGRIDKQVLFPPMSRRSAARIFTRMLGVGRNHDDVAQLAEQFAVKLPDGQITPAEVQGFLLDHRNDPEGAVKDVAKWSAALLEAKEFGKNVIELSDSDEGIEEG